MNIFEKLMNIQSELKAPKAQFNKFGGYNYRNCEDILEAVKPICKKYNTALVLNDDIVQIGERYYVKATAILFDCVEKEGQANKDEQDAIIATAYAREEESKKGMDGSQVTGASSSYARKYALNGLFNIDDTRDSDSTNTGDRSQQSDKKPHRDDLTSTNSVQQSGKQPKMAVEQALNYSMKNGKYAGKPFKDVPQDYLKWCVNNLQGRAAEAARITLGYIEDLDRQQGGQSSMFDGEEYPDDDLPFDY